jgi:hypothetical protein
MIPKPLVSPVWIEQSILEIRGYRVMLDLDVAVLYGVKTRVVTHSARRNINRFPPDFMFQLTKDEFESLRSHSMSASQRGGRRYPPFAFTAHGVAMLSTVLRSPRATRANVEMVRTFLRMRQALASGVDLAEVADELQERYDYQTQAIFDAIRQLMAPVREDMREPG